MACNYNIEFLFRDAKQFTGLSDCQARSQAKLDFHFNASLSAVTFAKLEARHQNGNGDQAFSMASLKRRAFNQHLLDRICEHLAVRIQRIVDTRCIQRIVDIVVKCIQRIVDIGHTHLQLGGESCPTTHDCIIKMPNVAAWR